MFKAKQIILIYKYTSINNYKQKLKSKHVFKKNKKFTYNYYIKRNIKNSDFNKSASACTTWIYMEDDLTSQFTCIIE